MTCAQPPAHDLEPSAGEHLVGGGGELRVSIPDQERDRFRMLTGFHDQVPGHLGHPLAAWAGGDTKDPHALAGVLDDGHDADGGAVEQGDGKEPGREDRLRLTAPGPRPGRPGCPARRGPSATCDDAVAVLEDAAQIPACRLAQDVATEKILAALAATRDGPGNPPATP
jgi:hypothetical protein